MYRDNIKFSDNFRQSVNLNIDLHNEEKINGFIATETATNIISEFVSNFESDNSKPILFIGPYGKGKSHLLLALSELLYSKDFKSCEQLVNGLYEVNSEVQKKLDLVMGKRYLPVVLTGSYDSFKSTLIQEIKRRLFEEGINEFDLKTAYSEALNIIGIWEADVHASPRLKEFLIEKNINLDVLKTNLTANKIEDLELFKGLYESIMYGQSFEPLLKTDIAGILQEVSLYLKEKTEFDGIFLVLDEFSKLLEGNAASEVYADIQNIAETAGRFPLKLVCVAHKRIGAYISHLSEDKRKEWKKIEGRFDQLSFGHFEDQSYFYRLIEKAVIKERLNEKELLRLSSDIYNKMIFAYKTAKISEELVVKGAFPLNPYTTYALIKLSEIVGQNERSLFSFLCDDQSYGLRKLVQKNANDLIAIDSVYDYFRNALESEKSSKSYKTYIKAETLLADIEDEVKIKIVKALAVIYLIDDSKTIAPIDTNVKSALNDINIDEKLNELINDGKILRKAQSEHLSFMSSTISNVQQDITKQIDLNYKNIEFGKAYDELFDNKYVVPRKYNYKNAITRFFKVKFIEDNIFMKSGFDTELMLQGERADGFILIVVNTRKYKIIEVEQKFENTKLNNVIFTQCKKTIDIHDLMKNLLAVNNLIKNKKKYGYDEYVCTELKLLSKEYDYELEQQFNKIIQSKNNVYFYNGKKYKNQTERNHMDNMVSKICDDLFNKSPKMNYEMINKDEITSVSKKGRRFSLHKLFDTNYDLSNLRESSAEKTIYRVLVKNTGIDSISERDYLNVSANENNLYAVVLNHIHNFFLEANDETKISELYRQLQSAPFGIRKGVIPIFLGKYLSSHRRNVVVMIGRQEIQYNVSQLEYINEHPENYVVYISHDSKEISSYLKQLNEIFANGDDYRGLNIYDEVFKRIETYMHKLPKCATQMSFYFHSTDYGNQDKSMIQVRNEFIKYNQNAKDVLLNRIPRRIYKGITLDQVVDKITEIKNTYDNYIKDLKTYLINNVTEMFGGYRGKNKLRQTLFEWRKHIDEEKINLISDKKFTKLVEYISHEIKNKDEEIIEDLSHRLISVPIEFWNDQSLIEFNDTLNNILDIYNTLEELDKDSKDICLKLKTKEYEKEQYYDEPVLSDDADAVYTEFEGLLDEYMINDSDKEALVLRIVTKHLKGEL
jgi:hypothetical protein